MWKVFVGKRQYFQKDGTHLNQAGHRKLDEMLCQEYIRIEKEINLSQRTTEPLPAPVQVSPESENNLFEGFAKEN